MSNAFKRKSYGKSKPVKQPKYVPVNKQPARVDLTKLLGALRKSADWNRQDILIRILKWYNSVYWNKIELIQANNQIIDKSVEKAMSAARAAFRRVASSDSNIDQTLLVKDTDLIAAIKAYQKLAALWKVKTPDVTVYYKKSAVSAKKTATNVARLEKKHDVTLAMLNEAWKQYGLKVRIVPALKDDVTLVLTSRRRDYIQNVLYYTSKYFAEMKKNIRKQGLLPVFFDEVLWAVTSDKVAIAMLSFMKFAATSPLAPNKLVVRTVPKPKKPKKLSMMDRKRATKDIIMVNDAIQPIASDS